MDEIEKIIVFQSKGQQYGVRIDQVMSIEKLQHTTEVPKAPEFIRGMINLRGQVTPVIDLGERLGLGETTYTEATRVLIVSVEHTQVGLIVDAATDVIDIDTSVIGDVPQMIGGVDESFIQGVANLEEGLLILLDINYVLNMDDISEVQQVIKN